jgi:hypothetical protein
MRYQAAMGEASEDDVRFLEEIDPRLPGLTSISTEACSGSSGSWPTTTATI